MKVLQTVDWAPLAVFTGKMYKPTFFKIQNQKEKT